MYLDPDPIIKADNQISLQILPGKQSLPSSRYTRHHNLNVLERENYDYILFFLRKKFIESQKSSNIAIILTKYPTTNQPFVYKSLL